MSNLWFVITNKRTIYNLGECEHILQAEKQGSKILPYNETTVLFFNEKRARFIMDFLDANLPLTEEETAKYEADKLQHREEIIKELES